MEACAPTFHEPVRDVSWEMIGADSDGENWEDHRDPQRAYRLFRAKLRLAARDGVRPEVQALARARRLRALACPATGIRPGIFPATTVYTGNMRRHSAS